jgi:hypothetical protein
MDSYNREILNNEILELQSFQSKVQKLDKKQQASSLVLGNKSTKLAIEDAPEIEHIEQFFANYGRKKEERNLDLSEIGELEDFDSKLHDLPKREHEHAMSLDREKLDQLLAELNQYLNFEDIVEIKKQINLLNRDGKLLHERIMFIA